MTPQDFSPPVTGPTYGRVFRGLATVMLLAVLVMATRAALLAPDEQVAPQGFWILGFGTLALVASYWVMMRSKTTIDAAGIRQSGLVEKKVEWPEVYSARLFGPPFARRLMVRTVNGRFRFFFAGSPELLAAFGRIAQAYRR